MSRMIEEYVPESIKSMCFGIFVSSLSFGGLIATSSGLLLPKDTDKEALEQNQTWRIIFGFPLVFYAIILFGFLLIIRHDSPKYYISKGDRVKAIHAIHQVY